MPGTRQRGFTHVLRHATTARPAHIREYGSRGEWLIPAPSEMTLEISQTKCSIGCSKFYYPSNTSHLRRGATPGLYTMGPRAWIRLQGTSVPPLMAHVIANAPARINIPFNEGVCSWVVTIKCSCACVSTLDESYHPVSQHDSSIPPNADGRLVSPTSDMWVPVGSTVVQDKPWPSLACHQLRFAMTGARMG